MPNRILGALPLGPLERFRDYIVMPAASILRPKPNTYRLVAKSDGMHVIASDGTDVGPLGSGAAYSKVQVSSGIDRTTTASAAAEIDSTLRVTITVPASGKVIIRQAIQVEINIATVADANLAVQVDGAGAWTDTGGFAFNANQNARSDTVIGELLLTGLTPGSHTFYMGWYQAGGATLTCHAGSRGGAVRGTWQSVTTLP